MKIVTKDNVENYLKILQNNKNKIHFEDILGDYFKELEIEEQNKLWKDLSQSIAYIL